MNKKMAQVALVTGAARRIGAETVRTLHSSGFNVIIHYRNSADEATELANELNSQRKNSAVIIQWDLLKTSSISDLARKCIAIWGRIDVLINNASAFYPAELGHISENDWDTLIGSNLKAPLFLSQALAEELVRSQGCIINMVDIHANRPLKDYMLYSLAKAGLVSLTRSLARELGPDVRCNGIAPGAILWPEEPHQNAQRQKIINKTALKRMGDPADIAEMILFLVTNADYITGQIITIDGGRTLSN